MRYAVALAVFALAGCRAPNVPTIAVVPKSTSHLFWQTVHAGAVAAGRDLKVNVEWNGAASETDYSRQIQIVDALIARRVEGIALAASERNALNASLDRAAAAKIPVTVFDSGVDSTNYLTFLSTNNYAAGQMAARKMGELLRGQGKVAVVLHAPGSYSTMERERGFRDALREDYPRIRIVAEQFGMSDRARSMMAAENMLTAHPDLKGIFCSTEPSSAGASLALKDRKLAGKVKFVGFDSSDAMVDDLKAGTLDAMVVQDPFRMGYEAVKTLVEQLHGQTPPKRIDLNAVVVSRPELDKAEIRKLLFPEVNKFL